MISAHNKRKGGATQPSNLLLLFSQNMSTNSSIYEQNRGNG